MKQYSVNHITSSPHYPQSNGLAEKYVQIVKSLFCKVKEEGKDMFKCLMTYYNTPLSSNLKSPMQILQSQSARMYQPMLSTARKQIGLDSEDIRKTYKSKHLPKHDYHIGQNVMYQDITNKWWHPTTITSLCQEPRSYHVTTREGVKYRKTQAHLKSFQPQSKNSEDKHCLLQANDM